MPGGTLSCLVVRSSEDGGPEKPDNDPARNVMVLLVTREIVAQNPSEAYQFLGEPDLMGHIAVTGPHTRYTEFKVPAENVLFLPGEATSIVEQSFGISGAVVGAMAVGTSRPKSIPVNRHYHAFTSSCRPLECKFLSLSPFGLIATSLPAFCVKLINMISNRTSYADKSLFPRLLNDAAVYSLFDGGNVGIRRRQFQKLLCDENYKPWANL